MSKQSELVELSRVYDTSTLSNRNLIINGAFQVAQRGTSATGVTAGAYNTVDRFEYAEGSGGGSAGFTISQSTEAPDGFGNSFKFEVTTTDTLTSGENCLIRTRLEGQDMQRFKSGTSDAESITVSFYVRASLTGTYGVQLMLGPAANATALQSITVNSADTWEYKTLTFAGSTSYAIPNDAARGFDLNIMLDSGPDDLVAPYTFADGISGVFKAPTGQVNFAQTSGATFHITGIQVEVGSEATPFEHRSYGDELARCSRYYQKILSTGSPNNQMVGAGHYNGTTALVIPFQYYAGPMRTAATGSVSSSLASFDIEPFDAAPSAIAFGHMTTIGCYINVTDPSARTVGYAGSLFLDTNGAFLEFDAEL